MTIPHDESQVHYSALEEFRRDERRPALLLLAALLIAALFFALGIMLGRWMADGKDASMRRPPAYTVHQSSIPFIP